MGARASQIPASIFSPGFRLVSGAGQGQGQARCHDLPSLVLSLSGEADVYWQGQKFAYY